jgi:hypothetical protein
MTFFPKKVTFHEPNFNISKLSFAQMPVNRADLDVSSDDDATESGETTLRSQSNRAPAVITWPSDNKDDAHTEKAQVRTRNAQAPIQLPKLTAGRTQKHGAKPGTMQTKKAKNVDSLARVDAKNEDTQVSTVDAAIKFVGKDVFTDPRMDNAELVALAKERIGKYRTISSTPEYLFAQEVAISAGTDLSQMIDMDMGAGFIANNIDAEEFALRNYIGAAKLIDDRLQEKTTVTGGAPKASRLGAAVPSTEPVVTTKRKEPVDLVVENSLVDAVEKREALAEQKNMIQFLASPLEQEEIVFTALLRVHMEATFRIIRRQALTLGNAFLSDKDASFLYKSDLYRSEFAQVVGNRILFQKLANLELSQKGAGKFSEIKEMLRLRQSMILHATYLLIQSFPDIKSFPQTYAGGASTYQYI